MTDGVDWRIAQVAVSALMFVIGSGAGVYAWVAERIRRRNKDIDGDVSSLQARAGDIERRLDVVEHAQSQAPTHQDLSQIYEKVNDLAQSVAALRADTSRIAESQSRVENHLLSRAGRVERGDG